MLNVTIAFRPAPSRRIKTVLHGGNLFAKDVVSRGKQIYEIYSTARMQLGGESFFVSCLSSLIN